MNPSQDMKDFFAWMNTFPDEQWPMCWEISGKDKDGSPFSISERYPTREAAEAAIPVVSKWADPASLKIEEVWDVQQSEEDWESWKKTTASSDGNSAEPKKSSAEPQDSPDQSKKL